ncbi:hypothetical protein JTB14_003438 [Gonioctena quinquepunctata]|nr:hypothetical protein JTB14_003438 [Gonioctena quinquepunctata]
MENLEEKLEKCEKSQRQKNPRENANILSRLTFVYTWSLFSRAFQRDLEEQDIYKVVSSCSSEKCGSKLEKQWKIENQKKGSPSIARLIWVRFGWRYVLMGCIEMVWKITRSVLEPMAVSSLISYFRPGQTDLKKNDAYYYAGLVLILHFTNCIFIQNYELWQQKLGIEMKVAFSSYLYRKSLKLSPSAVSEITFGNIVTLINKDVNTFVDSMQILNGTLIGTVQTIVICYLIYSKLGVASLIGIGIVFSTIPIQAYIGKWISKLRLQVGKKSDERLQMVQETLSTIKMIKMYTWEEYFKNKIDKARWEELKKMQIEFILKAAMIVFGNFMTKVGFYVLIIAYIWIGYSTDTTLVFYILSNFKNLKATMGSIIPSCIGLAAEFNAAITRIKRVMVAEELSSENMMESKPVVQLDEATVHIRGKEILRDVTFRIDSGLSVITGGVGSGKSSLLKTILHDYPLKSGRVVRHDSISYASQDPWLFPSSIKQNITFDQPFDEKKYLEVVRVCALEYDFRLFTNGDETIVSDRGLNLSKGQQARINLARAIYRTSEIYLLDDSLAALDVEVQNYIFKECIQTYLQNKICIFVSQDHNHIQNADNVIVMNNGRIKSSEKQFYRISQEVELLEEKNKLYSETKKSGTVDFSVYGNYIKFGGWILMITIILTFISTQSTGTYSDRLLTEWVDQTQQRLNLETSLNKYATSSSNTSVINATVNISVLKRNLEGAESQSRYTFIIYTIMIFSYTALSLLKFHSVLVFCRRSSYKLHKSMVRKILQAPMAFYDTHFIGNILNRFSLDLVNIDEYLPNVLSECLRIVFLFLGHCWLIVSVNVFFIALVGFIIIFSTILRMIYLPAGRSLKRLETSTRSPMIGHLNASLEGLTTIRACKAEDILKGEFDRHQDLYTSALYMSMCSMRAFGLMLDSLCSIFIITVVGSFILVDTDISAGNVGLAIVQVLLLGEEVQYGYRKWAELENLMTSTERVIEYTKVESETDAGIVLQNWPSHGAVTFDNVSLPIKMNKY